MTTNANYQIVAHVDGEQYHFQYEDSGDMWEALEEFWHGDYPDAPFGEARFAVDVLAMDGGRAIRRYETAFDSAHYHAFFDHGRTASGIYTLEEFSRQLGGIRREIDAARVPDTKDNQVTAFMFYMWNAWSEKECRLVWKDGGWKHFWDKWCDICKAYGTHGAAERFYAELSHGNRNLLVRRAAECFQGDSPRFEF